MNLAYSNAPRFDEGEICRSRQYSDAVRQRTEIFELLLKTYGDGIKELLWKYDDAFYTEMELEAMHFFREGYFAGQNESVL